VSGMTLLANQQALLPLPLPGFLHRSFFQRGTRPSDCHLHTTTTTPFSSHPSQNCTHK
jgi:hypothetical protein